MICEITNLVKEVTVGRIMVMMMIKDKLNWLFAICFSSVQSLSCVFKVGSPCSPRKSRVFSNITLQKDQFFLFSIELWLFYNNRVNQLCVYIYPLPFELPSRPSISPSLVVNKLNFHNNLKNNFFSWIVQPVCNQWWHIAFDL